MRQQIFAEVSLGLDTIAGGGVTGMLVWVMVSFLRRTKDTDDRRDDASRAREEAARLIMQEALRREQFAWSERDRALKARDDARAEIDRLRDYHNQERQRWTEDHRWIKDTQEHQIRALKEELTRLQETSASMDNPTQQPPTS